MSYEQIDLAAPLDATAASSADVYARVTRRLLPLLMMCYIVAYIDRLNVGFAKLQMQADLGLSDAMYGFGAGIFFIGYVMTEVPANLLLQKFGARKTLTRIMVLWGLMSMGTAFAQTPGQFYVMRFFLGVFEAGFFPGIVVYCTRWFPDAWRGRFLGKFLTAIPIAGIVNGPLSGWIMSRFHGQWGFNGWQWLFVLEGLPSVMLGLFIYFRLDESPEEARWLSAAQKARIRQDLLLEAGTQGGKRERHATSFMAAIRDIKVYALALALFCFSCGSNLIGFWMPTIIRGIGVTDVFHVGLLTAVSYGVTCAAIIANGHHSDRKLERRWHCAIPAFIGAVSLVAMVYLQGHMLLSFCLLSVAAAGSIGIFPAYWSIPPAYLRGAAAAGGVALINSLGQLAGFVSPFVLGLIRTKTGSLTLANWLVAAVMILGGLTILLFVKPAALRQGEAAR
ncbi:MFS transporter [Paraburkholderia unamae]|uniref:D-galactonate transporter n=1 Tax=Paraburkholderia unamae TaxID=219649 RepID=A0ABX5KHJ8_9BURK|nr:MFS transporter [Paraburkholderia unamae]PVX77108.1 D-galactonate transporter [Paraburkholderia unamae]